MRDDEDDSDLDLDIDLDLDDEDSSVDDSSASADATPAGGAQPGRRAGGDPERPRTTAAAAGPQRRRLSLWRAFLDWLRRHTLLAPRRCVVLGPSGSGKTALLMSLEQCEHEQSHSFLQYSATLIHPNADFERYRQDLIPYLPAGTLVGTTDPGTCSQPEFTLCLGQREDGLPRQQRGVRRVLAWFARLRRRNIRMRFSTFDGAGGLVVDAPTDMAARDPNHLRGRRLCREILYRSLQGCDAVLICLPIDPDAGGYYREQEMALKDLVHRLGDDPDVRDLVLCFTMYEKLGAGFGRQAYRTLTDRRFARDAMQRALAKSKRIRRALEQFRRAEPRRRVWCVPVSSFGFVPGNGGANLAAVERKNGTRGDVLRTRYNPAGEPGLPYTERQVWDELWQPFATLDPFIFIAGGFKNHRDTLIHSYRELWR
jgi:hypothetical protein